ncbi:polar amino acid transport system substrate-binding protein [Prauserella shujinwangii]|uniref:Polar amino acid transport system substrate-binding protein n=1 Tax=Prauserella shujinwangii TaxID=1453103 RepID=A0A2T0LYP6_9PSEU|nr:ectoine/hydroxyectoine ABC transporter substrate-binding protein EhuB [Prauserella shujinwangii]PRX49241.1 polar amino acid transport system substrate-binding protein [Prauserella shujinwangii]
MSEQKMNRLSRRAMLRYSAAGLAAVGGGSLLGACQTTDPNTGQPEGGGGGLQQRADSGQPIRLAIANEPPYTKLEADGTITGAAPDIAKAVLKRMGIENVEPKQTGYDSMIPGLQANRWDIVTAGLFMNQDRCAQVLYTTPDLVSTESYAVPPGNPQGLRTLDDLKNKDLQVAVLAGGYEGRTAKAMGVPDSKLPTYQQAPDALQAMEAGRVYGILLPTLTLESLKEQQGANYEITPPIEQFPVTGSGHAFRKSDQTFFQKYNEEMKAFKETSEFEQIMNQWGFDAEASRKATKEELCKTES